MEAATSIFGIIAFADLVAKYCKLVDTWREAPATLRRIKEKLSALAPVVAELSMLTETLQGFDLRLGPFMKDVAALEGLVTEMQMDGMKVWRRTKWTLRKKDEAVELEGRLEGYLREFMMVLAIVNQKSATVMRATVDGIADRQPVIQDAVLEVLGISREIHTRVMSHGSYQGVAVAIERRDLAQSIQSNGSIIGRRVGSAEYASTVATLASSPSSARMSTLYSTAAASSVSTPESSVSTMSSSKYLSTTSPIASRVTVSTDRGGRHEFALRHQAPCPGVDPDAPLWTYANCPCDRGYGQMRFRNYRVIAPHSGRTLDSRYLFEADLTTWMTVFGKFRFALSVQAHQQAWSWSFPSITLAKQNIRPIDSPVFQLAAKGDFKALVELFRNKEGSPHDRTDDGRTPLLFAISNGHLSTCIGLIDEGADVNATWTSMQNPSRNVDSLLSHAILHTNSDEIPCLLLDRGADPFYGCDTPESLFENALLSAGHGEMKVATIERLGALLTPPSAASHDDDKRSPNALQQSLKWGSLAAIQACLRAGFDVNAPFDSWESREGEAPRSRVPLMFALSFHFSRWKWEDEGWRAFNRGAVLKELLMNGADMNCISQPTEWSNWNVLHMILAGVHWNGGVFPSKPLSYPILCQLLVYFINSGVDLRAIDAAGRTPSQLAWDARLSSRSGNITERRVVLWYRALRMCSLDPWNYDQHYDERYDTVRPDCHFCSEDSPSKPAFIACPWCISLPYGVPHDDNDAWRHKSNPEYLYSSEDNLDSLSPITVQEEDLLPCCPMYACAKHCPPAHPPGPSLSEPMYPEGDGALETAKGLRLPKRPSGELLPYDMTGLTLLEIHAKYPRFVPRYPFSKYLPLPPAVEQTEAEEPSLPESDSDDDALYETPEDEVEFFDALESFEAGL